MSTSQHSRRDAGDGRSDGTGADDRGPERDGSAAVRTVSGPGGRQVAYVEYGDAAGVPVVPFHGTPGSRLFGALFDDIAAERGVRLLAVDRPGYGQSDPWRGRTLADTGAFVEPVLDDAGVDAAGVIGFSGGGPHALALAATRPERVRAVDLIASAAPQECVEDEPRPQRVLSALAGRTPRVLGGLIRVQAAVARRRSPSFVVSQYTDDPDAVPDDAAELVKRDFLEAVGRSRNGLVTESRLFGRSWDLSLSAVDCPVRLTHGREDDNVPAAAARRLADRLPDADLTVVDDADHLETLLGARESVIEAQATAVADGD